MKKKDLRNGDIVILRSGIVGLYMAEKGVIIYPAEGFDSVDDVFNNDLTDMESEEFDIMQVYRADGGVISFADYEEGDLIYERDETWEKPEKKEKPAVKAKMPIPDVQNDYIRIISQAFYGNRTGTEIRPKEMDRFILGYQDSSHPITEKIDRTIVRVPGTDNLIIVYNKYEDEKILTREYEDLHGRKYEPKPLAEIPEGGIKIYSRCIVCRMNEDGKFESLESGDAEKFMKYLAR